MGVEVDLAERISAAGRMHEAMQSERAALLAEAGGKSSAAGQQRAAKRTAATVGRLAATAA